MRRFPLSCVYKIKQIAGKNNLDGIVPTELGELSSLRGFFLGKLALLFVDRNITIAIRRTDSCLVLNISS